MCRKILDEIKQDLNILYMYSSIQVFKQDCICLAHKLW